MQDFNFLSDTQDLGKKSEPFAWIQPDEINSDRCDPIFIAQNSREEVRNLMFSMILYQLHRRKMYCNYMAGAKRLFDLSSWNEINRPCKLYMPHHEDYLRNRGAGLGDWCPHYELQRLALHTGIHWSWLHWAWVKCEQLIWKGNQSWQIKRLERIPFL